MDWQSYIAMAIALCCAVWVIREFARPFLSSRGGGCHGCVKVGNGQPGSGAHQARVRPLSDL